MPRQDDSVKSSHRKRGEVSATSVFSNSPFRTTDTYVASKFATEVSAEELRGPLGLILLFSPEQPLVDLIFVYGLGGGSRKTWSKTASASYYWPKEWLPRDPAFKTVRVHSFGYDSDWVKGRANCLDINHFARSLLGELSTSPHLHNSNTPIIFVGHSMGGLVIKKAFLLAKQDATDRYLVKRICAMYFLATPYSGSDSAKLLSNILNITYSSRAYVSDLKRGSDAIKSINYEFSKHSKDIDLWSFYETQKLNIGVFRVLIVDPDSATLGYRKEKCIPLNADHRSICKFDAPSDPNYILIRNALAVTINSAVESAQKSKERLLRSNINDLSEYLDVSDKFEDDLILVQDVRLPGTCEWIKSKESYLQWQDNDPDASRVFWLYGKPASGKSVLSEHLVSLLRTKHDACSFFFFKHGDRSKSQLSTCLRSLAFQMACVNTDIRQILLEMRERDVKLDGDDDRILWRRLFTSGIFKTDFQQHYWVIDALDECADLVSFFEIVLTRLDRSVPLRILVTSRQTSEIERRIALLGYDQVRVEHISMADTKEDIESFVRARANALIVESEADRAALAEMILGKSEGSWLWTVLVLNELSDSHSEEEIRQVLAEVPKGMEDLYLRTLDLMISGKFSGALISQPSAIYSLIPAFCPLETTIRKNASAGRKISVIGMSNTSWDDRLSCIAFHEGRTSALCHGHKFFAEYKKLDHGEAVMFLQFGTKADVLASCGFKKVLVWDIQNGHILYNFEVPVRPIGLAFDEDFLIIPTNKNYLTSWDLNNNGARQPDRPWNDTGGDKCTRSWRVPSVISISFGHRMLAVAYSGRPIALWDLEEDVYYGSCGKKLSDGRTSTHPVTALVFNPNPAIDLLVVSYLDGELVLLNPFDDQTLESRRANCHTLASSADGRLLAGSAGFGAIHIYEFDTLMLLYQVQSSSSCIKQLSFSINSLHCVDIRGSQCNVWEPPVLLRSSASDDTSENSSQSFIGAGATDSKVKISAIAVHYDRDVVLCGRDDGSVSLYDAKSGSRKLEICRHNSSVRILEWWTQRDLAISVDVSNKILAWKVRKSAQGEWVAERMAFQARLVYGGSIIQVLTSEATAKFIISTRGSDHLWQVDGHEENSRRYTDWASVRKWVQHPGSAYHAICFESTAARVYTWDKLSQVVSVSLDISVRALEFKSIKQLVLHSAKGVLVELSEPGGLAKTQNLYLLNAQSFEVDNKASIKHVVTVSPGLDDDLASLSIVEGQGVQEGDSLVSPVEPRLALLSQRVAQVIGICESSRLVFLDTGSWVCSVGLENPTSDITSYIRHFFIPYDWIAGSREVISAVLRQDILFARNDDLVIVRGGFDFTEEIYLQDALLREARLQIGDANHPETDSVPDLAIEAATAMTIVGDPLDHRHRDVADQPTEIGIVRAIVHPDTVGVEATVAAAALISNELRDFYYVEGLEEVRVIRDRQTKKSRQLGFLRFRNLDFARDFMDRNFPSIYLHGPNAGNNDKGTKVRIAYSREREDRTRARAEGDWTCKMCAIVNYSTRNKCFRCQAPRPEAGPAGPPGIAAPKVENNGDNDAAPDNQPSQFLLFRGLEASVTEELLAKGVAKLYRPTPGSSGSSENQRKGAKVASTTGDSNLGARDGSIRRVLLVRDRKTNESWRYGFAEFATVQDAQAAVARLHSFEKFTISSKPVLVSYIHAGVFVPVINPSASTDRFTFSPLSNPSLKLMYWDEEAYVKELTVSTAELDNNQVSTAQSQAESKSTKDAEKAKKRKADAAASAASKKVAVPSHLQFWSNRHAELHGIQKKDADEKGSDGGVERRGSPADTAAPPTQSYADLNRNCCYLCMRQFKSSAEVNRHERLSQLHRDNLQNDELKNKAMGKLIKHGIVQSTAEYRDRARERRKAFGSSRTSTKAKPAAPKEEDEPPVETTSKGASLLSKMGWSAGSGLGAQGTGMTAPIATEVYAQGVGLGAQGSKLGDAVEEAGRNTRNRYDEFLEKTRQTARERYERMDK
ncbi:hypothetical protein GB937_003382 [Aspergillus fischeri]|nr:hypothetical protein GB937_003382 [Aspergillus fischeri]